MKLQPLAAFLPLTFLLTTASAQIEPGAGAWKTWVTPASSLRLDPPAHSDQEELAWLKEFRKQTDARALQQVAFWDAGSPSYRWVELLQTLTSERAINTPNATRAMALLNIAIYDAMVAAWDNKYRYNRPRPSALDASINSLVRVPPSPGYPSEHAVAAGAAAAILGYLFPAEAGQYFDLASEAARSRLFAGVQLPSDIISGLELGRRSAEAVITRARADGSNVPWTGTVPTGPQYWRGTNPVLPLTGTWKTWALRNGDEFRPGPPIAYDSPQMAAELAELRGISRTFALQAKAFHYQSAEGGSIKFQDLIHKAIFEDHLEHNAPRAARAYALVAVANYDATIAVWDAKYAYWAPRPTMLDTTLVTLFAVPNHPSYPAAHSTNSTAATEMLAFVFPSRADYYRIIGEEAGYSRMTAGIHYRSDHEVGSKLGRDVAQKVVAWAANDGSK